MPQIKPRMVQEFRPSDDQCDHEWELDCGSGQNYVDMDINRRQKAHQEKANKGEVPHRRLTGDVDLRAQCRNCDTAIWFIQYAVCGSNTGSPYLCRECDEIKENCYCEYCIECDEVECFCDISEEDD